METGKISLEKTVEINIHNDMDTRLIVKEEDIHCWTLLERIDADTRKLIKFFKAHGPRLYAALYDGRFIAVGDNSEGLLGLGHKQAVKTFEKRK